MKKIDYPIKNPVLFRIFSSYTSTMLTGIGGCQLIFIDLDNGETPDYTAINVLAMTTALNDRVSEIPPHGLSPELMKSEVIDIQAFFGERFNIATKEIVRGEQDGLNNQSLGEGYVYSVFDTPYGIPIVSYSVAQENGISPGELEQVFFEESVTAIFGDFSHNFEIRRWSTDWAPAYFGAGLEWWGAFWWTIHDKDAGRVIVVGASETD